MKAVDDDLAAIEQHNAVAAERRGDRIPAGRERCDELAAGVDDLKGASVVDEDAAVVDGKRFDELRALPPDQGRARALEPPERGTERVDGERAVARHRQGGTAGLALEVRQADLRPPVHREVQSSLALPEWSDPYQLQ